MQLNSFNELFGLCEKFHFRHPLKDKYYAFIAPSGHNDFLAFLKEWNVKFGATFQNLVLGDYLSKTDWRHAPLGVYVMSETEIKECIAYNAIGRTHNDFLIKFPYPCSPFN